MAFNIGKTNEERLRAASLYQRAFGAKKLSESRPPDGGDVHIVLSLGGISVLLAPGGKTVKTKDGAMCCELHFDNEASLKKAFDVLSAGSLSSSLEGPYPWAYALGLVTDKFGVSWALYYNK